MSIAIHLFLGKEVKLIDLLNDVKTGEWFELGLALTTDEGAMDIIAADHKNDGRGGLRAIFRLWKKKCPNPTWDKVVTALNTIGDTNLAPKLKEKYCS